MSIVYFHIDTDGKSSAALIKRYDKSAYCIPVNYGFELHKDKIRENEKVYIVDFTFPLEDMLWLKAHCDLTWIDHHQLMIDDIENVIGKDIKGIRDSSKSGIELTWDYLYPGKPYPQSINLMGAWDLCLRDKYPNVIEFEKGLSHYNNFPSNKNPGVWEFWDKVFNDILLNEIIQKGSEIYEREKQSNKITMRAMAFEKDIMGYRTIIANVSLADDLMFDSVVDPNVHDLIMGFYYHKKGYWKVGVRLVKGKTNINVAELCKKFGGGGHPSGAGGFMVKYFKDLPFADNM
jgi:oligoribonuclease NrnB/cAMP/cGMP phosphodiesterase (DHH superfamily)